MNICYLIDEEIRAFTEQNGGRKPAVIRLGRLQLAALKKFEASYTSSAVEESLKLGVPNYEGIPIETLNVDEHLSIG